MEKYVFNNIKPKKPLKPIRKWEKNVSEEKLINKVK